MLTEQWEFTITDDDTEEELFKRVFSTKKKSFRVSRQRVDA